MRVSSDYNGLPMFEVTECDFIEIIDCLCMGGRLLSKNIHDDDLREYYINTRKPVFAVSYKNTVICWGK